MHYYKHHIGDHRSQTMHLSNEEDLAYRRLKDWYLGTEKPIPLETQWVSRRLQVALEALESVLHDFFQCTENGWVSPDFEKIIADYQAQNAKNAANGRKGGRPKAPEKNPVGFQPEPSGKPNHKPLTTNQEPYITKEEKVLVSDSWFGASCEKSQAEPAKPEVEKVDATAADKPDKKQKRGTRLPADWRLPKAWGDWALAEFAHWTADIVRTEADKFRDYWHAKSGKDATKADWLATWRNWCRSDIAQRAHRVVPMRVVVGGKAAAYQSPLKATDSAAETEKARRMLFGGTPPDDPNTVDVDARFVGEVKGVAYA